MEVIITALGDKIRVYWNQGCVSEVGEEMGNVSIPGRENLGRQEIC